MLPHISWRIYRMQDEGMLEMAHSCFSTESQTLQVCPTACIKNSEFHQHHKWEHRVCLYQPTGIDKSWIFIKDHLALDANKEESIQQCSHVGSECDNGKKTGNHRVRAAQTSSVSTDRPDNTRGEEGGCSRSRIYVSNGENQRKSESATVPLLYMLKPALAACRCASECL